MRYLQDAELRLTDIFLRKSSRYLRCLTRQRCSALRRGAVRRSAPYLRRGLVEKVVRRSQSNDGDADAAT